MIDLFRRWFEYEKDMHAKVLTSMEKVPEEGRQSAEFRRALSIFAHVVAARGIWLSRLGIIPKPTGPLFPDNRTLEQVAAEWDAACQSWTDYLARSDDAELARVCDYHSLDGKRFRNRVEEILTQLFCHSSYHRGQIAMLIRAAGGEPAITDFIYWCREAV